MLVCYAANRGDERPTRVGIIVSKRLGKATTRNRVKRRIREAVRSLYAELPSGYDLVLIARSPATDASVAGLVAALQWCARRANLWRASEPDREHRADDTEPG